jgi:hypothetical protein
VPAQRPSKLERLFHALLVLVGALGLWVGLLGVSADSRARPPRALTEPQAPVAQVAEAERDGALRISVKAEGGGPIDSATVRVLWEKQRRYFDAGQAMTSDDGVALVTRVPRGRVWILAEAEGFARTSTQLVVEGGARQVLLELSPASTLKVRVTDEAHAPLPGATVLVTTGDPLPFGALTDAGGNAELRRLGKGPLSVKASAPGYESVTRAGVSGTVELALRRLGSLTVHVRLADGTPAAGAQVEIGGATLWPARSSLADAAGDCKIAGLLPGSYDLRATLEGQVSRVLVGLLLGRGEDQQVTLTLEPGRFVTALVTDGSGPNPHLVPNADVVLAEEGLSSFPLRGRSGTDGKVTLGPISNGPATLSGRAADFVGSAVVAVPDVLTGPVPLPLLRGGVLDGEVVDARGFPVDGASIEVIGSDGGGLPIAETPQLLRFRRSHFSWAMAGPPPMISAGELGVMPGPIPPIPGSNAALTAAAVDSTTQPLDDDEDIAPWITSVSGHFRAAPVTPGRVRALVRHPDFVEGVSDAVSLAPGGQATVKVTLLRGGSLEGRLKDDRDNPIEGAEIEVVAERGTFQRSTITSSDGSFAFSALPREVTVNVRRAENPARIAKRIPIEVAEGEKETLEIVLPALRDPMSITVLDDEGRAVELAEVNVLSLVPMEPLRDTRFTDTQGKVTVNDARGLQLRITVQAPGFVQQTLVVGAAEAKAEVELRLSRGALIEGRVTALRGRQGVQGALVTLHSQGMRKTTMTNVDGDYRFADVALGQARLSVSHPDYAEGELSATIKDTGRRDRAFALDDIDLQEPGAVEGEVLDERGDPVAGARVAVGRAPSYLPAGPLPRGVAVTDARGAFNLTGLRAGPTTIDVYAPERGRGSARVDVQGNRTQSVGRVTLKPSGSSADPFAPGGVAVTLGERGSGDALEVVVVTVAEGSEAERAGLLPGDVIASVNDAKPTSMQDARGRLSGPLQTDVVVGVLRGGGAQRFSIMREAVRK